MFRNSFLRDLSAEYCSKMCKSCREFLEHLQERKAQYAQQCQEVLQQVEDHMNNILAVIDEVETNYRILGRYYHATNIAARNQCSSEHLQHLKEAFHISTLEEYNAYFEKWHRALKMTREVRSEIRLNGTPETLAHRTKRVRELIEKCTAEIPYVTELEVLKEAVDYLLGRNSQYCGRTGNLPWTNTPQVESRTRQAPKCDEWELFRAWCWSLPETQRAVQTGRSVDDIANEMLYKCVEKTNT